MLLPISAKTVVNRWAPEAMNTFDETGREIKSTLELHLEALERARQWFGVDRGRILEYPKLIREFHERRIQDLAHLLAFNESCEITDIVSLWEHHISNFPGLMENIREALCSGALIPENENPSTSSNKPRNDAFVYFLAGRLLAAGIDVIAVNGIERANEQCPGNSDISIRWNGRFLYIQCKRMRSERKMRRTVHDAREQLRSFGIKKTPGIVGLDCSVLIRPPNTLLTTTSAERASQFVADRFTRLYAENLDRKYQSHILGFIMFARVPAVAKRRTSPILSQEGRPFTYFTRESICTFLVIGSSRAMDTIVMPSIAAKMKATM